MGFHVIHMHTFEFSIKLIHKVKTEIAGKFVGLYTEFLNKSACPFRLSSTVMMMLENVLNCFKQQASSILMLTLLMRIKLPLNCAAIASSANYTKFSQQTSSLHNCQAINSHECSPIPPPELLNGYQQSK